MVKNLAENAKRPVLREFIVKSSSIVSWCFALLGVAVAAYGAYWLGDAPKWGRILLLGGALLGAVSAGALLLRAELRLSIALTLVLATVGTYSVNVYIGMRAPDTAMADRLEAAHKSAPGYDQRTVLEVVRDMNAAGTLAVPALFPANLLGTEQPRPLYPLAGISRATTVLCNESGAFAVFESDEHGFNNPRNLPDQVDVLVVGDSFAQGACVAPGKDIAGQLRATGIPALNLGTGGSGPILTLATLIEFGLPRRPRVVVWLMGGNDFSDVRREWQDPTLRRYVKEPRFKQHLLRRQDEVDQFWRRYLETYEPRKPGPTNRSFDLTLKETITLYPLRKATGLTREMAVEDDLLPRVFSRARDAVAETGARLVVVTLPYWHLIQAEPDLQVTFPDFQRLMAKLDIPVVDFAKPIASMADPLEIFPFRLPGHFTAQGYAMLRKQIVDEALRGHIPGFEPAARKSP